MAAQKRSPSPQRSNSAHLHRPWRATVVAETVCLVCHMRKGQFDIVREYVDARESFLMRLGLKLLPLLCGSAIIEGDDRP